MRCPTCRADSDKVIDSRSTDGAAAIRRRRQCIACGRRFTTKERVEEELRRILSVTEEGGICEALWNLHSLTGDAGAFPRTATWSTKRCRVV